MPKCSVVDDECLVPANAPGTVGKATCFVCRSPVCKNCSKQLVYLKYGLQCICGNCIRNPEPRRLGRRYVEDMKPAEVAERRAYMAKRKRESRARAIEEGRCMTCGNDKEKGREELKTCKVCSDASVERNDARRTKIKKIVKLREKGHTVSQIVAATKETRKRVSSLLKAAKAL